MESGTRTLVVAQSGTPEAATADFVCDGSNDETEINAAINLLGSEGGGTVSIAAGHYSISTNIAAIRIDNIHLQGAGTGQTVITTAPDFYYTNFQAAIGFSGVDTFSCRGITVDASGASDTLNGIQCDLSQNGVIEDCESFIRSGWSYAIWSLHSDNIEILNNHVRGANTYAETSFLQEGIELFNSNNVVVEGNTIENIGNAGIFIFSPTDTVETSNIRIEGNSVNYAARGVFIAHEGPRSLDNIVITGNAFTNSAIAGIHVWNIDFNNFSGPGPAATIENPQHIHDIAISDNTISFAEQTFPGGAGILLENSAGPGEAFFSDIDVSNNTIFESLGLGTPIKVIDVPNVEFVGNSAASTVDYQLGAYLDNLTLVEDAAGASATGNEGNNLIQGNSNSNFIIGGFGNDTMVGGRGDDVYEVTDAGDVVIEQANEGFDTVRANIDYVLGANVEALYLFGDAVRATGNADDNLLNTVDTGAANNILIGGAGDDTMAGGRGDDIYEVTDAGDVIIEQANEGFDTVRANIDYVLGANVEALYLFGDAVQATGNADDNLLNTVDTGAANNILIGGAGDDTMAGGRGDDIYEVTDAGDVVIEQANEGFDTVRANIDYVLGANVEALYLFGDAVRATGSVDPNIIDATNSLSLDNIIDGAGGADVLTGGLGNDTFVFNVGEADGDTVTDFSDGDRLVFVGFGPDATFSRIGSSNQWKLTYDNGAAHEIITLSNGAAADGYFVDNQQPALTTYTSFANSGFADIYANWAAGSNNDGFAALQSGDSERYIFAAAIGVTWVNGTGLTISDGALHWSTLTSIEHRSADGSILYESITNFDTAFLSGGQLALDGHELGTLLSGADIINGSSGSDAMIGFEGDDIFNASGGADQLDGGGGADTFIASNAGQLVSGLRLINIEKIEFNFSGSVDLDPVNADTGTYVFHSFNPLTVTLNSNASPTNWTTAKAWVGGVGQDNLVINHADTVATGAYSFSNWTAGVDTVTLNGVSHAPGGQTLVFTGTPVNDTINTFGGNDNLFGNAGDDVLNAGGDDDLLGGGTGNDILNGGAGVDTGTYQFVTGDANDDAVTENIVFTLGNGGNGTAAGGAQVGTDQLNSIENLRGGSGNDTFNITDSGNNIFIGNGGIDTIDYSGNSAAVTVTLGATSGSVTGIGTGNDSLDTIENVITGAGNDVFNIAKLSPRVLDAGAGNDTISFAGIQPSEATSDTIDLTAGSATGGGPGTGTVTLVGFENATGGAAGDVLTGNGFANVLSGLDGNDELNGLAGADQLFGGAGADKFMFDAVTLTDARSATIDRVRDYDQGGGAYNHGEGDQIDLSALLSTAYNHGSGQTVSSLVRAIEDASGTFANLQIDTDGTANGANWITIARLDGIQPHNTLNIILDSTLAGGSTVSVSNTPDKPIIAPATFELAAFGSSAGNWIDQNHYPRQIADVNGDGKADIVGFAKSEVTVSLATGNGDFAAATDEIGNFGFSAGGWTSQDLYPRLLADVNGDGMADIVGFGAGGVVVSLATGDGHFAAADQ